MKRIILTLCMTMIACITVFAQKALFEKYSETDGVSTVYISRNMMRMMGNVKAGNKDISKVAGRLDYLQILSCERPSLIPGKLPNSHLESWKQAKEEYLRTKHL